jgi:hypothetical protein
VAGAAALALIIAFVVQSFPAGLGGIETAAGDGAQIGDHWHAGLVLEICAEEITLPPSGSGVHSHGDGLIHVHPHKESETGAGANLGRFFDSFDGPPMLMESDRIRVPDGELYENGQPCPDGEPGNVQVLANGEDITQTFRSYTPREGDFVEVYFR